MSATSSRQDPWLARGAAVFGVIAFLGNLLGVAVLGDIPQAYKPVKLEIWLSDSLAHPDAAVASALYFTIGVLAMVPFAVALARLVRGPLAGLAVLGAAFIATGALMNGSATMAPFVIVEHLGAEHLGADPLNDPGFRITAFALLGWTLTMDAVFNALLGVGMILAGAAMWRDPGFGRITGGWGMIAGLATVPVVFQPVSYDAALWLVVAGPLWVLWLLLVSARLWRLPRHGADERRDAGS
ncbi:MAG: hypothetical protein O3A21_01590 [Proteobacteria bacterium]|nr:hypothetical protein [Pseudomonadota bacterium]